MSAHTPSLTEVLDGAIGGRLAELNVAIPGKVVSYDRTLKKASVQPLIRRPRTDASGNRVVESLPVINGVPVAFPGAGEFAMTWPLAAGDLVLLIFCHSSLDKWLDVGGEVDPLDPRRFNMSDAVAIPGIRTFRTPDGETHATAMVISAPDEIHVGGSDSLATKDDVDALAEWIHTTMIVNATGATAGTTLPPPSAAGTTKLKGS